MAKLLRLSPLLGLVQVLVSFAVAQESTCPLFDSANQRVDATGIQVQSNKTVLLSCHDSAGDERVATRKLEINGEGYLLLTDPVKLSSRIERDSCWKCVKTSVIELVGTRLGSALFRLTEGGDTRKPAHANMGLNRAENSVEGIFLTGDLCPSVKPLDRKFFTDLAKGPGAQPVALAVTGRWMESHGSDLKWLKEQVHEGKLDITWVNHSFNHPFVPHQKEKDNFLLKAGSDLDFEVLQTEKAMIERGLTPSVFFRFPGLVSNDSLMDRMRSYSLIPLGTSAWLAKGEEPQAGSIVLVHPNGNEPAGIQRFAKLKRDKKLVLPLLPINEAPSPGRRRLPES